MRVELKAIRNSEGKWLARWWPTPTEDNYYWVNHICNADMFWMHSNCGNPELDAALGKHGGEAVTLWLTDEQPGALIAKHKEP
jgi:hypothetical protein